MAQPHKGPRRGFLVRWSDEDGLLAKAQAGAAGMTTNDYLTHLVRQAQHDRLPEAVRSTGRRPDESLWATA